MYLTTFFVYLVLQLTMRINFLKYSIAGILLIVLSFNFTKQYSNLVKWRIPETKNKVQVYHDISNIVNDKPLIISTDFGVGYYTEPGLLFAWFFTGKHREYFQNIFKEVSPDKMVYDHSVPCVWRWNEKLSPADILDHYDEIYFFVTKHQLENSEALLGAFNEKTTIGEVYSNQVTGDKLYFIRQ